MCISIWNHLGARVGIGECSRLIHPFAMFYKGGWAENILAGFVADWIATSSLGIIANWVIPWIILPYRFKEGFTISLINFWYDEQRWCRYL